MKEMKGVPFGIIVGISIGVVIGILLALFVFFCIKSYRRQSPIATSSSQRIATAKISIDDADTCTALSDSSVGTESPKAMTQSRRSLWRAVGGLNKANVVSASGILQYTYRDLQKGTRNFTALIGKGSFGSVYKAEMSTGDSVAVKVLAAESKQGEKEFQSEVMLLGRLHHRNLVNLVGYCAEKGHHMLMYVYMSNGSLASHLYGKKYEHLSWGLRVQIALDVARGLEYLHDGAVPPVIHRDIKSSNILLDHSMRARVADFGLSREEMVERHASHVQGTFGYLDPEYISTRTFTNKSDVYSLGVLLFELIAGRNPQQGLMEYVELARMNADGKLGWEEIVDPSLDGNFDMQELNDIAALAYKCVNRSPRKRPSIRDIVQVLSCIPKRKHSRRHRKHCLAAPPDEISINMDKPDLSSPRLDSGHERVGSIYSSAETCDVQNCRC